MSRVILSIAKNLAECPGQVLARDPSALRFVGMTLSLRILERRTIAKTTRAKLVPRACYLYYMPLNEIR